MFNIWQLIPLFLIFLTPPEKNLMSLQRSLDEAFTDDEPIALVKGDDFTSPPGTIIFASREKGKRIMIRLARSGEPELSMLFLPRWNAWITQTKERKVDFTRSDIRYAMAAMATEPSCELWHTHNNVGEPVGTVESLKRSVSWTMPSSADLIQLYDYERDLPGLKFVGVIASIYGITTYRRNEALDDAWSAPIYVRSALRNEADKLHDEAREIPVSKLPAFASSHKGYISLRFESAR